MTIKELMAQMTNLSDEEFKELFTLILKEKERRHRSRVLKLKLSVK